MVTRILQTSEPSEAKRRQMIEYMSITQDCECCGKNTQPAKIRPKRGSTDIIVEWQGTSGKITCSKSCTQSLVNSNMPKESYLARGIKSSETQKGRTYEDIFGERVAFEKRQEKSNQMSENNPRWSTKYRTPKEIEKQKEINRNTKSPFGRWFKGKSYEEVYGEEKAKEIKEKLSIASTGENNAMYGKPSPLLSGGGTKGWYRGEFFRSSLELMFMHQCWKNGTKYENAETKEFRVTYQLDGTNRTYHPDFYLPDSDTIVEIKPSRLVTTEENVAKFKASQKAFKNFEVLTEHDIDWIESEEYQKLLNDSCIELLNK